MDKKPKGYWIGHVTVDDPQAYQAYREAKEHMAAAGIPVRLA